MNKEEVLFWIWLSKIKGVGPILSRKLLEIFKKPSNIYSAEKDELLRVQGIGKETARKIYQGKDLAYEESILENCIKKNIKILTLDDTLYPKEVKEINETPIVLYYRGNLISKSIGIGIVGSRRCTPYGKRVAVETAQFLAQNNIPVIGGMAKGIDSYSHTACIKEGGYTIAVLGNGVDVCYPKEHIDLMEKIIDNGAAISEYSPGTKPDALRFPKRNRIISAFSKRLLVVEAGEKSGALITASYSKKYKREVYSVPNNIYSMQSKGTNELIYNGAKIFLNQKDLIKGMEEYKDETTQKDFKNSNIQLNKNIQSISNINKKNNITEHNNRTFDTRLDFSQQKILSSIIEKEKRIEELIRLFKKENIDVLEIISVLELEGRIKIESGIVKAL